MAKHVVKCRRCQKQFDANEEEYAVQNKKYYHKSCYEKEKQDALYIQDIHSYMWHILGASYSKMKIDRQIKELLADGKEPLWINKAIKYWFSVKNGDPAKANGGIRIVNFIYDEAIDYYKKQAKYQVLNNDIDIKAIVNKPIKEIHIKPKPVQKPKRVKIFELK